jgi:hypothetical protein
VTSLSTSPWATLVREAAVRELEPRRVYSKRLLFVKRKMYATGRMDDEYMGYRTRDFWLVSG